MELKITAQLSPVLHPTATGVISRGVKSAGIDAAGHLILILTDEARLDLGRVVGTDGLDGISPTVSVAKLGGTATIVITDATGNHSVQLHDGARGETGASGVYCGADEPTDPAITVWIDPTNGGA